MTTNIHQAIALHQEGKLEEAEKIYRSILEVQPTNVDANNNLGVLLYSIGRLDEAETSYRKAIELKPNFVGAYTNLGNTLKALGKLDEAITNHKKAIELQPDDAEAYNNLGIVQQIIGKLDEAEASYRKAIEIKPNHLMALNNLGSVFNDFNKLDEAIKYYNKALELNPNFSEVLFNRGNILFKKGQYEPALKDFDACKNSKKSIGPTLWALYALGRIEEIYQKLDTQFILDDKNLQVAAFSSFITAKEKRDTKYNFCNNPIDFIYTSSLKPHLKNFNLFINELIEKLYITDTYWQPFYKTTKKGFQSIENIFKNSSGVLNKLESIIMHELDTYYLRFKDKDCSFIKKWPYKKYINGWHVILKQDGHQNLHMHSDGWLSGVIYLKVIPPLEKNEGAIEFSLNGENYFNVSSPKLLHQPKVGDIIFFPSSLHHKTIPFSTDTDRIIVSFDLLPQTKNIKL